MTILRRALVSHSVLVGMLLIELAVYYPRLPDRVVSHFGASGEPDGWQSKQAFTTFTIAFPIVLAALMIGAQATMLYLGRIPISLVNLPNKKYWLAPERRAETLAWVVPLMSNFMLWMGVGTTALMVIVMGMALRANLMPEPRLTYALPVVGVYMALVVAGTIRLSIQMYRRFGRIPAEDASEPRSEAPAR
ncbi:MAG TPA: DUF1648 domain-containing protein [Phycisphaerae bacterium]|nr:DUF1648 domain-containing protein [Phycisphaerae bacterium]HON66041.1 DUF1648 domain-containing protein [Phycisphaerae bacterium]